jgi:hypothetical protein
MIEICFQCTAEIGAGVLHVASTNTIMLPKEHLVGAQIHTAEIVDIICKITPEDKWTTQLTVKNMTPHIYTESVLKTAFHSTMGIHF